MIKLKYLSQNHGGVRYETATDFVHAVEHFCKDKNSVSIDWLSQLDGGLKAVIRYTEPIEELEEVKDEAREALQKTVEVLSSTILKQAERWDQLGRYIWKSVYENLPAYMIKNKMTDIEKEFDS